MAHGNLLNTMACVFTNNTGISGKSFFYPENSSLTVLDFFLNTREGLEETKTYVDFKLSAYNLQIIQRLK